MDHLHVLAVYGGSSIESQMRALRKGAQVIVATPGRLIDLMHRGVARLDQVENVVLDKADIGEQAIIAAGAVVLAGSQVGPREIWAGVPARKVKTAPEGQALEYAEHYMYIKEWYREP